MIVRLDTDTTITLDDRGSGRPILLLHAGAGPASMMSFAEHLATTRPARVLTPTIPGFDATPRPAALRTVDDLARTWLDLLDHLDLHDVTVVGNSVGGWTAARIAVDPRATARVSGVVLLNAVGIAVPDHPITDITNIPVDRLADLSFHDPDTYRINPAALPAERRAMMAANAAVLADYAGDPYMHDPTLRDRLADATVPVLVAWGESDHVVDLGYGRAYAASIPGAEFRTIKAAGHLPQLEQPDLTRDAVWEFADR